MVLMSGRDDRFRLRRFWTWVRFGSTSAPSLVAFAAT